MQIQGETVSWMSVDFRHVLYAGWICSVAPPAGVSFAQINRLCEHGIMQQRAISIERKIP
jgi:hypothetical protein